MNKKIFVSKKAQKHSSKGDFSYSKDGKRTYKMMGGGHGQENIEHLRSRNIDHAVLFEYDNGVRRGNVSIHRRANHRTGDSQCWFPDSWTGGDIADAGRHVMSLKRNKRREDQVTYWGVHKNVKVGVKTSKGYITTIFPSYIQEGERKNFNGKK